jgi:hypothetical protein
MMTMSHRRRFHVVTSLLWCGVLAPLLVAAVDVAETFMQSGINIWQQSISLLSEGPNGGIQRWGLALSGLLTLLFAVGLGQTWRRARSVMWSEVVLGGGLVVAGLFIQQGLAPANVWRIASPWGFLTLVGVVHIAGSAVLYAALAGSCLLTAAVLPHTHDWRRAVAYSMISGVLLVVLVPTFVVLAGDGGPSGLLERLAALAGAGWQVWLASLLVRGRIPDEGGWSRTRVGQV